MFTLLWRHRLDELANLGGERHDFFGCGFDRPKSRLAAHALFGSKNCLLICQANDFKRLWLHEQRI